jgi:hypothetical protein
MRLTRPSLCRCPCAFNSEHTRLHQSLWAALRVREDGGWASVPE